MRLRDFIRRIKDARGVATSLVEATATIGVGAVLATVAIGAGVNAINDAKVQTAVEDVRQIGQGIFGFYKDNNFYPLYQDGAHTGPSDPTFTHLVSANGTYPLTLANGTGGGLPGHTDIGESWGIVGTPPTPRTGYTGDGLFSGHDSIEDQLVANQPGFVNDGVASRFYPLRGTYAADPTRGYNAPYVQNLPPSDPWGNKYVVNIQELSSKHEADVHTVNGVIMPTAVFVCSAGENRVLETNGEQSASAAQVFGDDICFRVK
jgi:type II secretory pathway pseudopilin PulG